MTCIEKLRELHPDWNDEKVGQYIDNMCPENEFIMISPEWCGAYGWEKSEKHTCEKCWNREVLDEDHNRHEMKVYLTGEESRRLRRLEERLGCSVGGLIAAALKTYEDGLNAIGFNMEVKEDE